MTRTSPRRQNGQLTRLAGLLTYSTPYLLPVRIANSGFLDWSRLIIKSLQQRDCTGLSPVSLLIRTSKGGSLAEQDAAKIRIFSKKQ